MQRQCVYFNLFTQLRQECVGGIKREERTPPDSCSSSPCLLSLLLLGTHTTSISTRVFVMFISVSIILVIAAVIHFVLVDVTHTNNKGVRRTKTNYKWWSLMLHDKSGRHTMPRKTLTLSDDHTDSFSCRRWSFHTTLSNQWFLTSKVSRAPHAFWRIKTSRCKLCYKWVVKKSPCLKNKVF